jgi:hypothetical protein
VLASGDRSSAARPRYAAPASHSATIDPHC